MPFYDFKCAECGKESNIRASVSERESGALACPECGSKKLERVFKAGTAHIIKQSGTEPACPHAHVCGAGCRHAH